MSFGGFGFTDTTGVISQGGDRFPTPTGVTYQPPPPGSTSLDPFGPTGFGPDPQDYNDLAQTLQNVGCSIGRNIFCNHPTGRGVFEAFCGPCQTPLVDPVNGGRIDPGGFAPGNGGGVAIRDRADGCVPCGKNECKVPYIVKSGPCAGQTRFRKGRLVEDPRTGQTMCVPKTRKKFNLSNGKANARSRSRFAAVLKDAHKSIDAAREAVKKPASCK